MEKTYYSSNTIETLSLSHYYPFYINPLSVNDASRPPKFSVQNSAAYFKLGTFPQASFTNYTQKKKIF